MIVVCDHKTNVMDASVAESFTLRKAVELCSDLNFQKAIFEGDAKVVIIAVHSDDEVLSSFSSIVEDIRFYFRNRRDWHLQFTLRETNMVVHTSAKKALALGEEQVWIEEVPILLWDILIVIQVVIREA